MDYKIRIEAPTQPEIFDLITPIKGWISGDEVPSSVSVEYGGRPIATKLSVRPDVERAFPGKRGIGFNAKLDLRQGPAQVRSEDLTLTIDGKTQLLSRLVASEVKPKALQWRVLKDRKLNIISEIAACPICHRGLKVPPATGEYSCPACSASFKRNATNLDMLPQSLRDEFRLIETENVSAHPYPPEARTFIKETADAGGLVLDMGSGDQSYIDPSVICAEIVAYPATDILSVGQRLPFQDAVFDGVYTNAVLEHVTDPFTCAQELMRVLKPGGRVFCSVPFLQPEHGYPHHYYNMTQDGLTNLFTRLGASVIDKAVPAWGHPLYAGQWFLSAYLNYLPTEQRKKLEGLTVSDFLKLRRSEEEPAFASLSEEGMRVLACATYATFSKPA